MRGAGQSALTCREQLILGDSRLTNDCGSTLCDPTSYDRVVEAKLVLYIN